MGPDIGIAGRLDHQRREHRLRLGGAALLQPDDGNHVTRLQVGAMQLQNAAIKLFRFFQLTGTLQPGRLGAQRLDFASVAHARGCARAHIIPASACR